MSIVLEINNPNTLETQLFDFLKKQKNGVEETTVEVLKDFLNSFQKKKKFDFKSKDPKKHSKIINREYNSEDVDDFALAHIADSAEYIHDLRRKKTIKSST